MSEISFKGMLESVKGHTLTDKQCAKFLNRALKAFVATAQSAHESLALAEQEIEWSLDQLARLDKHADAKPLTQHQRAAYEEIVRGLAESRQSETQFSEYVDRAEKRVSKVVRLIDQLVVSVTSAQNPK